MSNSWEVRVDEEGEGKGRDGVNEAEQKQMQMQRCSRGSSVLDNTRTQSTLHSSCYTIHLEPLHRLGENSCNLPLRLSLFTLWAGLKWPTLIWTALCPLQCVSSNWSSKHQLLYHKTPLDCYSPLVRDSTSFSRKLHTACRLQNSRGKRAN